jgi:uncharacterized protein GlcG (DUF336 family)
MLRRKKLTLDEATAVISAVVGHAKAGNHAGVACVVVDANGDMIAGAVMDGRAARVYKSAQRKAYSAAKFEHDTSWILELYQEMEAKGHRGPQDWNDPILTTLAGGYVVVDEQENVLGAIGVGGGSRGDFSDWAFAKIGLTALGDSYHHRPGKEEH